MNKLFITVITFLLLTPHVNGQALRNTIENANNNRQIAEGKAWIIRDQREIDEYNSSLMSLREALGKNDLAAAEVLRMQLLEAMKTEVREGEKKLTKDRREVSQSHSEVRSENREIRDDRGEIRRKGSKPGEIRDIKGDKYDRKDDRRDLKDDRRDIMDQNALLTKQKSLLAEAEVIFYTTATREQIDRLNIIFDQFVITMEKDLDFTRDELQEDRMEKVEDRFERHDDRQERRDGR